MGVLVELDGGELAGGHVKCWERLAEAAASVEPAGLPVDLTVYLLGQRERVQVLSPSVRLVRLRPVLGTGALSRIVGGVDATDVTPYHRRLAGLLPRHDVWHLTHLFGFAATALRLARRRPAHRLVASVHTDVPALVTAYVDQTLRATPGLRRLGGHLPDLAVAPARLAALPARRRRDRFLRACDRVLVATEGERVEMARRLGEWRVGLLGRGIDLHRFRCDPRPAGGHRDEGPEDRFTVLFVGRVDASKRVTVLGEAVRLLRDAGRDVRLLVAGDGAQAPALSRLLGPAVTLLGVLPQDRLAAVYRGSDVLAFPSHTETVGNVVAEAMACGLPPVLPAGARTTGWLDRPGVDGVLVQPDTPAGWAATLAGLMDAPALCRAIGGRAAHTARTRHRSWLQVLRDDLLPVWLATGGATVPREVRPAAAQPACRTSRS